MYSARKILRGIINAEVKLADFSIRIEKLTSRKIKWLEEDGKWQMDLMGNGRWI
jgi:hypothetical protein